MTAKYPDGHNVTKSAVRTGSVWVGTIDGCDTAGTSSQGFTITADGLDEDGNPVTGYVLGVGDLMVLDLDGSIVPEGESWTLRLHDEEPETPHKGDTFLDGDTLKIYDGEDWVYQTVPTKLSDLQDDIGVIHVGNNNLTSGWVVRLGDQNDNLGPALSEGSLDFEQSYTTYASGYASIEDDNSFGNLNVGYDAATVVIGGSGDYEHKGVYILAEKDKPVKVLIDGDQAATESYVDQQISAQIGQALQEAY